MVFLLTISALICSVHALHHDVKPYASFRHQHQRFAFVPRGGSSADNEVDAGASSDVAASSSQQQLTGLIDLRPEPGSDSIIFYKGNNDFQQAYFPTATNQDEITVDEDEMNEQAASSNSIGTLCSTVYLIISYNFDDGKTSLHRNFGGTKLMAFIDGVRSRRHELMLSNQNNVPTKLILVFLPSSASSAITLLSNMSDTSEPILNNKIMLDLTSNTSAWDASGATYLVDRLSEAFALGGEEYQNMNPFVVEMIGVFDVGNEKEKSVDANTECSVDETMNEVVLIHTGKTAAENIDIEKSCTNEEIADDVSPGETSTPEHFQDLISSTYKAAGGTGEVDFR